MDWQRTCLQSAAPPAQARGPSLSVASEPIRSDLLLALGVHILLVGHSDFQEVEKLPLQFLSIELEVFIQIPIDCLEVIVG